LESSLLFVTAEEFLMGICIFGPCTASVSPTDAVNEVEKRVNAQIKKIQTKKEVVIKAAEMLAQAEEDKVNAEGVWGMRLIALKPFVQQAQAESPRGGALAAVGTAIGATGAYVFKGPSAAFKIVGGVLMAVGAATAGTGAAIIWLQPGKKLTRDEAKVIVDMIHTDDLLIDEIQPALVTLNNLKQGIFSAGGVGEEPLRFSEVEDRAQNVLDVKIAEVRKRLEVPRLTVQTP
jgi:hypothetical protein